MREWAIMLGENSIHKRRNDTFKLCETRPNKTACTFETVEREREKSPRAHTHLEAVFAQFVQRLVGQRGRLLLLLLGVGACVRSGAEAIEQRHDLRQVAPDAHAGSATVPGTGVEKECRRAKHENTIRTPTHAIYV